MLNLPQSTEVNKNIAKNKFYEKADISSTLKESFVNDIEKIVWANKLSSKTLNISGSDDFKELEVFHIKLKTAKFNPKILEAIDKAIPYYILFAVKITDNVGFVCSVSCFFLISQPNLIFSVVFQHK